MRFPTIPLLLAGLCAGSSLAYGERGTNCVPTKAQIILREKMAELESAQPPAGSANATKSSATLSPEQDAKAREALREKLDEMDAPPPASTPTQVAPPKTAPAPVVVAQTAAPAPESKVTTPVSRTGLNAEQEAKAREALRQQMEAMQPPAPAPAPVQTSPVPVAPAVVAKPPAAAPKPAPAPQASTAPAVAATALTPEQEAKAREALRQQMEELQPPAPAPVEPTPAPIVKAPAPVSKPVAPAPTMVTPPEAELPSLTQAQETLAREALRQKMAELDAAPPTAQPEPSLTPEPPAMAAAQPPVVQRPPSQKQGLERLNELTDQYREGLMTPQEYHQERAKIVQSLK